MSVLSHYRPLHETVMQTHSNTSERAMYRDYRKEADLGQWGGRQCLQWQERES